MIKPYEFKEIIGTIGDPLHFQQAEGIPITLNFMYFDKEGKCWSVIAHGTQKRVESNDRTPPERFTGFANCPEPPEKPVLNPVLPKAYYFGPWNQAGHRMHGRGGRSVSREEEMTIPWHDSGIDGVLQPHREFCKRRSYCECRSGPEGRAMLHHKAGWTALAFWDRSVDTRGACNSTYLAQGEYSFNEMVAIAKAQFAERWARQKFEVVPA